jgi:tetratricopeptide (TPR) repeat protein
MPGCRFARSLQLCFSLLMVGWHAQVVFAAEPDWRVQKEQAIAAARSGAFARAEDLLHSALASLPDANGMDAALLWNQLGVIHLAEPQLKKAKEEFQRAIEINARLEHPSAVQEAIMFNNLGSVLQAENDFKTAETWFRKSYALLVKEHLTETSNAGPVLDNLAVDLQQQDEFTESEKVFQEAIASIRKFNGEQSLEFAKCVTNLGLLRYETGHFQEAVVKHQRALAIQDALPPSSVSLHDRAYVLNNLGLALGELGRSAEARAALLKAIELEKGSAMYLDPRLPKTLNDLAGVERNLGNLDLAKQYGQEALRYAPKLRPGDDELRAGIYTNLGMAATKERNYREAKQLYSQAASIWIGTVGINNPKYAATQSNMASLEAMRGHHKHAKEIFSKCLAIDESWLGQNHPQVATDLANLGAELFFEKKYAQAIDLYNRARQIDESTLGPMTPEMASLSRNLAIIYQTTKRYAESQTAYAQAIHILEALPGAAPELPGCLRSDADVLRKLERFSEAEQADLEASKIEVRTAIAADQKTIAGAAGFRQ